MLWQMWTGSRKSTIHEDIPSATGFKIHCQKAQAAYPRQRYCCASRRGMSSLIFVQYDENPDAIVKRVFTRPAPGNMRGTRFGEHGSCDHDWSRKTI